MKGWILVAVFLLASTAIAQSDEATVKDDIQAVVKQGRGTDQGRAAWQRLSQRGPDALLPLLEAMNGVDIAATNWLRTAFDQIAERTNKGKLPTAALLAFAMDAKKTGRARRLALDLVEQEQPGAGAKLYPHWLEDPEFRFEAVALTLEQAKSAGKAGDKKSALERYRTALAASRDMSQARAAAAGLGQFGETVSVAQHLGFLMDWHLIGPFDGMGQKGFKTSYPPEKKVDLAEVLEGQAGQKLRWKHYRAQEPPPTSGGRHQALVNLAEKSALGEADDAVAFAYAEFSVAKGGEVEFRGAADDNFTVWVNGEKVFGFEEWRNGVRHDRHRFKANLKNGKNAVLVKICQSAAPNPEPNWEFFLRVVDATGKGIVMKSLVK